MEMEYTRGCMAGRLTVDGTDVIGLTEEQRKEVRNKIAEWICSGQESLYELLIFLIERNYDDYKCDSDPCECCGDYVETYKWRI